MPAMVRSSASATPARRGFLALALLLSAPAPALADETSDLRAILDENVVTTASTSAERASTAPATSVTITAEDLELYGIRSLDEAINFLSLGVITSDPLRTPDIGARGVLLPNDDGKHFLLLVNGHAMNDPLYGAARFDSGSGIPLDAIDHIEVIVGPGSVLYGSNAMLGVINVITKTGSDDAGGHVSGDYEIGRSVRAGAGAGAGLSDSHDVVAHGEYFERFGPDLEFDLQPNELFLGTNTAANYGPKAEPGRWGGTVRDAYFTRSGSGIVRWRLGDLELSVLGNTYQRGIPYTTATLDVDFDDGESYELDRALRFEAKHYAVMSTLMQLTSRVYADTADFQRRLNRAATSCFESDVPTCQAYKAGLARWLGAELRLALNWLEDSSLVTTLGVDARMRWVRAKEEFLSAQTLTPIAATRGRIDDSAGLVSPYIQQTWSPVSWLDMNAGARLDADERFDPIISPRAAVAILPGASTTLKTVYSQAFRAPSWTETHASERDQVAAPDLEPEIVRSVEASIEQGFGSQRLLFGGFYTHWNNLVEPHVLTGAEIGEFQRRGELPITASGISQFRNVSDLVNYGYNGAYSGTLAEGHLRYGFNATAAYTRRNVSGTTERLPVAPQLFGNARLAYVFGAGLPSPALAAYYVGQRPADRAFADWERTPYADPMLELRATLSGPVPGITGLRYRLSASYATASEGPYVVGARQDADGDLGTISDQDQRLPPEGTPIDRFKAFIGLKYDFLTPDRTRQGEDQ
jgi:outer membrane receptor for ferrienterochelin and colicins